MGTSSLLWRYLGQQPSELYGTMAPWHLLVLLILLGLLSAVGIHHVLGANLRLYKWGGADSRWLSIPTLVVLMVSVQIMLLAYGLAARAPALLEQSLSGFEKSGGANHIGTLLLAPALGQLGEGGAEIEMVRLVAAIRGTSAETFQNYFHSRLNDEIDIDSSNESGADNSIGGDGDDGGIAPDPPSDGYDAEPAAPPNGETGASETPLPNRVEIPVEGLNPRLALLEQLALGWLIDPDRAPPGQPNDNDPSQADAEVPGGSGLPEFVANLLMDIQEGMALTLDNWTHLAGTRFTEGFLVPWMTTRIRFLALGIALAVLLANAAYLFLLVRTRRLIDRLHSPPASGVPAEPVASSGDSLST